MTLNLSHKPHRRAVHGFTLLEMSIVLAIMSIVAVSVVTAFSVALSKLQYQQTITKMEAIQYALYQYRFAFNRMPCPADATITINTTNFGVEAANPGSCTGGAPAANFSLAPAVDSRDAREGMVPTKTLQLPDDYAFDGWGRRFMYAVSADYTEGGSFLHISSYDAVGRMTVLNQENDTKSSIALEVLVSFGPNGHGAFGRGGGGTRISASSANTREQNNCDCDASAAPTGLNGSFVQQDIAQDSTNVLNGFDDIVYFSTRADYLSPATLLAQPFSASAAGGGLGAGAGGGGGGTAGGGNTGGGWCGVWQPCADGSCPNVCTNLSGVAVCQCSQ